MPMLTPWPECPYTLLVSRATRAPYCRVWPAYLQHRLPITPVPLLTHDVSNLDSLRAVADHLSLPGRPGV